MKTIDTLITDIEEVIEEGGGWDSAVTEYLSDKISTTLGKQFTHEREHSPSLRMSNIGTPCQRRLWYSINEHSRAEELPVHVRLNFTYGHLLEDLVLALVKAAGHTVTGEQDRQEIDGLVGHRDCVIDGVLIDVKSASSAGYWKFARHELEDSDPFGYLGQLSSYLYAAGDDPLVTDKQNAGFLVINKNNGRMCLDMYDLSDRVASKQDDIAQTRLVVNSTEPPERHYELKDNGKSGNKELGFECSHCPFKSTCYPDLRVFRGYRGPVYLAEVAKEPRMEDITDEYYN
jgi:hypothetical protein